MVAPRPGWCGAADFPVGALYQVEFQRHVDRALDRRAADLAVALGGVGVADREDRAIDFDGQIELDAGGDVADIHVSADISRRDDALQAGRPPRPPDPAREGPERPPAAPSVHRGFLT